jgi:transposase
MAEETPENRSGLAAGERRPRRRHSLAQKLAIVRECLEPGASLAGVALAHRVNANMVRKWVVKYRQGGYGQRSEAGMAILPVVVKRPSTARSSLSAAGVKPTIEIELARGVVRLSGAIDRAVLRLLIEALAT